MAHWGQTLIFLTGVLLNNNRFIEDGSVKSWWSSGWRYIQSLDLLRAHQSRHNSWLGESSLFANSSFAIHNGVNIKNVFVFVSYFVFPLGLLWDRAALKEVFEFIWLLFPAVIPVTAMEDHVFALLFMGTRLALRGNGQWMSKLILIKSSLGGFIWVRIFFEGIFLFEWLIVWWVTREDVNVIFVTVLFRTLE